MLAPWIVALIVAFCCSSRAISTGEWKMPLQILGKSYFVPSDDLLVVSVATNQTDGYYSLIRSLKLYRYKYEVGFREGSSGWDEYGGPSFRSTGSDRNGPVVRKKWTFSESISPVMRVTRAKSFSSPMPTKLSSRKDPNSLWTNSRHSNQLVLSSVPRTSAGRMQHYKYAFPFTLSMLSSRSFVVRLPAGWKQRKTLSQFGRFRRLRLGRVSIVDEPGDHWQPSTVLHEPVSRCHRTRTRGNVRCSVTMIHFL